MPPGVAQPTIAGPKCGSAFVLRVAKIGANSRREEEPRVVQHAVLITTGWHGSLSLTKRGGFLRQLTLPSQG